MIQAATQSDKSTNQVKNSVEIPAIKQRQDFLVENKEETITPTNKSETAFTVRSNELVNPLPAYNFRKIELERKPLIDKPSAYSCTEPVTKQ